MGAAVALRDIVGEAKHLLLIRVVPLHRDFDDDAVLFGDGVEYVVVQHRLIAVDELDKSLHAAGKGEVFLLARELVDQADVDAVIEEGQFAQPLRQDIIVIFDRAESACTRQKMHLGTAALGGAGLLQRRGGNAVAKLHAVGLSFTAYGETQPLRQSIDHGHADAVQAA